MTDDALTALAVKKFLEAEAFFKLLIKIEPHESNDHPSTASNSVLGHESDVIYYACHVANAKAATVELNIQHLTQYLLDALLHSPSFDAERKTP